MEKALLKSALATAITLACQPGYGLDFNQTLFFGDSLTDSGAFVGNADAGEGGRFTTNPGPVWSEILAAYLGTEALANNPNNPDNTWPDGTNYAQGGAQVLLPIGIGSTPSPQSAQPITVQIDNYLDSTGGAADGNALYSVWGGANDLFYNLALVGGGLPVDDALANAAGSADALVAEVERLADAGADYILVPNIPDLGVTPSMVLQVVAATGNDDALATAIAVLAQPTIGVDAADVYLQALAAAELELGYPAGALTPAYMDLSALSTGLALTFNGYLSGLSAFSDANIIPLDTFSLINEAQSDPTAFGLVNVTGVSCLTPSSLYCTADYLIDPAAPEVFMFADGVHPSSITHQIIADYALSVITAPALVTNLADVPARVMRGHQDLLLSRLTGGSEEGWGVFGSIATGEQDSPSSGSESDDRHLLLGARYRTGDGLTVAVAVEKSSSDVDFSGNLGGFELDAMQISLSTDYRSDLLFASALVTFAPETEFDDIRRVVNLGNSTRTERAETEGDGFGLKLLVGGNLYRSGMLTAGPFASLNYQSWEVDGYVENGESFSSMFFGNQSRESLLLELGLFADIALADKANFHVALSREEEMKDEARSITAGLFTLPNNPFQLHDIQPADGSWKLDLRVDGKLTKGVSASLGYQMRDGDGDYDQQLVSLGLQVDF